MYGHRRIRSHRSPVRWFSIINTTGPWSMPNWYGVTHQPAGLSSTRNDWLNEQRNPYGRWWPPNFMLAKLRTVGRTISGANGSEATTTQGATVPSSGPNGA